MILEVALLQFRSGQSAAFEATFRTAQGLIESIPGYDPFPTVSHYEAIEGIAGENC